LECQHVRRNCSFLKSTQVFNEAHTPTTTLASLPYSFSDFVDFSTVKENSFASYAFFNLDTFNLGDDHDVRAFRALYVSLIWQCHSDLPWTANCGPVVKLKGYWMTEHIVRWRVKVNRQKVECKLMIAKAVGFSEYIAASI
jgi:hypothetical protein